MIPLSGYGKAKIYVDSHAKLTEGEIADLKKKYPGPCLTISRQSGIDTNLLCNKLVESLTSFYSSEWAYFDKDLIRKVISDHHLPIRVQKLLNEERESKISEMLNEMFGIYPPILEVIHKVSNTILNLAEIGDVILIGRGSNIITSRLKNTFHIRLLAPIDYRIDNLQSSKKITNEWARKILLKEDENRKDYLYRAFRKDIDNPLLYHLMLNVSQFSVDELVKTITEAIKIKYPKIRSRLFED